MIQHLKETDFKQLTVVRLPSLIAPSHDHASAFTDRSRSLPDQAEHLSLAGTHLLDHIVLPNRRLGRRS
jgi:hypothetical protein